MENHIFSKDESDYRFTIEVTQEDRFLKENTIMKGYLDRGSIAFYEIYNEKEGALMINVNTQNQNCGVLRVKRGENRSHNSGEYDFITSDSSLLIPDAEKMHYDISV